MIKGGGPGLNNGTAISGESDLAGVHARVGCRDSGSKTAYTGGARGSSCVEVSPAAIRTVGEPGFARRVRLRPVGRS